MELGMNRTGLNPQSFLDVDGKGIIQDVKSETLQSKNGKDFQVFTVMLGTGETIARLLRSDLNVLVNHWGSDSTKWIGKAIEFGAVPSGKFYNWELKPILEVQTELVQ